MIPQPSRALLRVLELGWTTGEEPHAGGAGGRSEGRSGRPPGSCRWGPTTPHSQSPMHE